MNNPIYIKLKYLDGRPCIIKVEDIDEIEPTKDRDASKVRTEEYIYTVRETPEQIEKALKAAGIQVIDCGASVGEEPAEVAPTEERKKWFIVKGNEGNHGFEIGEKVYNDFGQYFSNGSFHQYIKCDSDLEPLLDEPTLTNDKN